MPEKNWDDPLEYLRGQLDASESIIRSCDHDIAKAAERRDAAMKKAASFRTAIEQIQHARGIVIP